MRTKNTLPAAGRDNSVIHTPCHRYATQARLLYIYIYSYIFIYMKFNMHKCDIS